MGEVALMSPTLPSGITDSITMFTLEKIDEENVQYIFHLSLLPRG